MIEHLRKYTGLIIFVMALVFVGLTFLGKSGNGGGAGDPTWITVDGTSYSYSEYHKLGPSSVKLAQSMGYQFYGSFCMRLGLGFQEEDQTSMDRFVANRLILRKAGKDFGISPTDDEVAAEVKDQMAFQKSDGGFDQEQYNNIVKNVLGKFGMTEKDLLDLVRDKLLMDKLSEVLGSGLASDRRFATDSVSSADQRLTLQVAKLELSKFEETLKPTDEELKAEWETTKDKYPTDKRMKVTYLIATPAYPEPAKEDAPLPATATDEEKKAAERKKAADATAEAEAKRTVNRELGGKVNEVLQAINNTDGADFEKAAAAQGFELKTTDFFATTALPAELDLKLRNPDGVTTVGSTLSNLSLTGPVLNRYSTAIPLENGKYLVVRADEIQESHPKEFEEAKELVQKDYVKKHAQEALKKDADEKAAKIREGLTAGKSFADLAKEMGLEVKNHGPFGMNDRNAADPEAGTLFEPAATVDPGKLADPVTQPDGALLIFVEKREIYKDDSRAKKVESTIEGIADRQKTFAFTSWLEDQFNSVKVTTPKR